MPQLTINRIKPTEAQPAKIVEKVQDLFDRVQKRAYELFLARGSNEGSDLDDWFKAERELVFAPPAQLKETAEGYELEFATPGFSAGELNVTAAADSIVVEGKTEKRSEGKEDGYQFTEFNSQDLFRRLPLPAVIDTDHVYASLDNGILKITAKKAEPAKPAEPKPVQSAEAAPKPEKAMAAS